MTTPLLEVRSLIHVLPNGRQILNNICLRVEQGSFAILAGPNGCGKTMLMRHLNGLSKPTEGKVLLDGMPISRDLRRIRCEIGLVFQNADAQIVGPTVERDCAFGPENLRLPREEIQNRVESALKSTGLGRSHKRQPHTLSGGEKRRLSVAGVVAMRPRLLILDEPFTGLDWPGSADLINVLLDLNRDGTTILLITHDLVKILAHADRLIIMNTGTIVADGSPEALINTVENYGIRRPVGPVNSMSWAQKTGNTDES